MKTQLTLKVATALLSLSTILHQLSTCFAQGTAFTYQGRLNDGANPASGIYDLRFTIYDVDTGGTPVAGPLTNSVTGVTNGLFSVNLDFGGAAFSGANRWLEIGVRSNGAASFFTLSPRQALTPAPYAITASQVSGAISASQLSGTIPAANIASGSISGASLAPGAALANLNASGQAGVARGGIVLSATENPALANAGYAMVDTLQSGNLWLPHVASLAPAPPVARQGHTVVWTGTELIIWGGMDTNGHRNDGARYVSALNLWRPLATAGAPTNRAGHTAIWTGKEMIVWGGTSGGGPLGDGGRYDPESNTWNPIPAEGAPVARSQHTAVWTGKEMIIWGGHDGATALDDGARYHPGTASWEQIAEGRAPTPRSGHTAVWADGEMLVWGGVAGGVSNEGGKYNLENNQWSPMTTGGAPSPRYEHTAVWTGTEMIIWGGSDGGFMNDGARYLPGDDKWLSISGAGAPAIRTRHTAVWTGTEMFVWGGLGGGSTLRDGARYNPAGDSWTVAPTNNAPSARWLHAAVWTGTEMILWGGLDAFGGNPLNDGGRFYSPVGAWTQISDNAPAALLPRTDATCVWTGSEFLFWGGRAEGRFANFVLGDGWRFHPASLTVTPIPTNGAPPPRWAHTAVWTGNEMIVWGGSLRETSSGITNDGARYLPAANLWLPLNSTSAPSARAFHTATWTGNEMIVWGGSSSGDKTGGLDTGARYFPASDVWTPLSTNNAPSPRFGHSVVWTGSEMIVWGGKTNVITLFNTGARYHPVTDSWTTLPTDTYPSARSGHTAVWTGDEMIVWGGTAAGGYVRDGARYSVAFNLWRSLPTAGAPVGRENHAAVWTGKVMLVWGGKNFSGVVGDGSSYDTASDRWLGVTSVGAPPALPDWHGVWDGKEVLITGGFSDSASQFTDAWAWTPGKVMFLYEKP